MVVALDADTTQAQQWLRDIAKVFCFLSNVYAAKNFAKDPVLAQLPGVM